MKLSIFCPFGLKMPIHARPQNWGFGGFHPQNGEQYQQNPKVHILVRVRVVWTTKRENPSTGLTRRWVPEKGINKKKFRYISPICPEAPHGRICTKFGRAVGVADVIICNNFWWSVNVKGCGFCGGSKIVISHWQGQSPLTQGWRYRAARDNASLGFSVVAQLLLKRNAVLYTAVSANVVECGTLLTIWSENISVHMTP